MTETPQFFVPLVPSEDHEKCYQDMAKAIGQAAPALGKRVYSITFTHNGETWTATVGETLVGSAIKSRRVRGKKVEREIQLRNHSTVMAIFPGLPFHVWHDGASNVWANPFLTVEPRSITYFRD